SEWEAVILDGWHAFDARPAIERAIAEAGRPLALRFLQLPRCGRAACWNRGLAETGAPLVVLLGDDFFARPELLEIHLALHQRRTEPHVIGLGPGIFPPGFPVTPFMRWLEDSGR